MPATAPTEFRSRLLPLTAGLLLAAHLGAGLRTSPYLDEWLYLPAAMEGTVAGAPSAADLQPAREPGLLPPGADLARRLLIPLLEPCWWMVPLIGLAVHAVNVGLLWLMVRRATRTESAAYLAAAMFALWPLGAEVVQRATLLPSQAGMTCLLAAGWLWLVRTGAMQAVRLRTVWPSLLLVAVAGTFDLSAALAGAAIPLLSLRLSGGGTPVGHGAKAGRGPDRNDDHSGADPVTSPSDERRDLPGDGGSRLAGGAGEGAGTPADRGTTDLLVGPVSVLGWMGVLVLPTLLWMAAAMTARSEAASLALLPDADPPSAFVPLGRRSLTRPEDLAKRLGEEFKEHTRFLPFLRYSRQELFRSIRQLPATAGEGRWWVWAGLGVAAAAALAVSLVGRGRPGPATGSGRPAAAVTFAIVVWFLAMLPAVLVAEHQSSLRAGFVGGMAQAVVAGVAFWLFWRLAVAVGAPATLPARLLFGAVLVLQALCVHTETWQLRSAAEADHLRLLQVRAAVSTVPQTSSAIVLVIGVPGVIEPVNVPVREHVTPVWAYPWTAEAALSATVPGRRLRYMATGYPGFMALYPADIARRSESVRAFRFPRLAEPGAPTERWLEVLDTLEFRTVTDELVRTIRVPVDSGPLDCGGRPCGVPGPPTTGVLSLPEHLVTELQSASPAPEPKSVAPAPVPPGADLPSPPAAGR